MLTITKRLEFDAGHRIPQHKSQCRNLHGHRYALEITLEGEPVDDPTSSDHGMLMDFTDVKAIAKDHLVDLWDHAFLVHDGDTLIRGLLAQILAGRGLSAVTVAIDPAPFRGVLPLPLSALKAAWPVLNNPSNRHRAVPLSYEQFRFAFANAVGEMEAQALYRDYAVPGSGAP